MQPPPLDRARLDAAYRTGLDALLKERHPDGYWIGELSSSALSTATAVMALHLTSAPLSPPGRGVGAEGRSHADLIERGLAWLVSHQNPDGGWGDTDKSYSNISTTMLCRAAFYLCSRHTPCADADGTRSVPATIARAEAWLAARYGSTPAQLAEAVRARYGKDRTFATPILTTCALAGLVDWSEVPPLPFELACFPQSWFRFLRLHVVSYALPALIAIGQCIYHHKKPRNPLTRFARRLAIAKSLRVLERIQPSSGGFLEATPLTSFVTLSLAAIGLADHPVARNGVRFLMNSVRPDGSWAIDSNLSTWVTTLAINALAAAGEIDNLPKRDELCYWLLRQQHVEPHPYTGALPGGWAWTPLPGGVPDADDTPGALIAMTHLGVPDPERVAKPYFNFGVGWVKGIMWLRALRNVDGGWPTFCRGWGHLPFDRSGSDLTAHALRAIRSAHGWQTPISFQAIENDWNRGEFSFLDSLSYLSRHQRPDGSWLPLWFGNQHMPDDENPTYGTARVLAAYRDLGLMHEEPARRGVAWLVANQNDDGGWGGGKGSPSSMEETALAAEILIDAEPACRLALAPPNRDSNTANDDASAKRQATQVDTAVERGFAWLIDHVELGDLYNPTPIGFYFAKLWYYEKLYPMIFTVAALGRARVKYAHERQAMP
jgi:squalene-hopene/tetraprenyl-beta-curcumene cyclase